MRVALLIALVGCRQVFGIDDTQTIDARSLDAVSDGGCTSWSKLVDTCTATFGPAITIGQTATLDTSSHVLTPAIATLGDITITTPGGGELDVVFAESFDIAPGAILHVLGSRPFAVVTPAAITIEGTIDLRAGGAGARMACSTDGQPGAASLGGGGGGGGGGFSAAGGHGGSGDSDGAAAAMGGAGGSAVGLPAMLVGGCPGGRGGDGNNPSGAAALGGGAVLLASMVEVDVSGQLLVSGGGGKHGGCNGCGGGGGGSGGMIVIEAPIVTVRGVVSANGGGGGEGEIAGNDGTTGGTNPGQGGTGGTATGGDGADGGSLATPFGTDATDFRPAGGGGGGGGCGFIALATAPIIGAVATIDPPYVAW